jgi:hypothetical protein
MLRSVLIVVLSLCGALWAAEESVVLKSDDGRFEVKLPAGWAATQSKKPGAVIRAQSADKDMLISVSPDPKEDYDNLDAYADKFLRTFGDDIKGAESSELKRVKVNGAQAIQGQVEGSLNGARYVWTITAIETESFFVFVQVSAPPSVFRKNRDLLTGLVNGLREVAAKKAP